MICQLFSQNGLILSADYIGWMPEIDLKVPFAEKETAKQLARAAGGYLKWDADRKIWIFVGSELPDSLKKFGQKRELT